MNKFIKKIFIFIMIIIFIIAYSGSYQSFSIDNLAVALAIGIDTAEDNNLQVTFQFTNASSVSENGTSEKANSILHTVTAPSISSALNVMNSYIGKQLILTHCKIIVFSESMAEQGIEDEIYTLMNNTQIRPTANIIISKSNTNLYLDNSKPVFENLLTKYYEVFIKSSSFTGYTTNATIGEFFNHSIDNSSEAYAIIGSVHDNIVKNTGLAIFKDFRLSGELNELETLCFSVVNNKLDGFLITIPNPEEDNKFLDIYLTPSCTTSHKVDIINGSPFITVNIKLSGRIYSMESNNKYTDSTTLDNISSKCETYMQNLILSYLYKTSKNYNSDINNFGKSSMKNFLTLSDYEDFNWNNKYKDSFFSVKINCNISSSMLLTET